MIKVTGVSAGALIAPFTFPGPNYDADVAEAFTGGAAQILGDAGGIFALLGSPDLRRLCAYNFPPPPGCPLVDRLADGQTWP